MLFWAASSPRTQPQPLHLLNPHHRIVFQWLQGTYVAWKLSILRPMKPLKWEHHSSMTTYTAVEYMAWFKIKSVTVRFSHCAFSLHCTSCSFIVSILVGEFLMVGRYPMIYFSVVAFEASQKISMLGRSAFYDCSYAAVYSKQYPHVLISSSPTD